jgi:transketolase
MKNLFIEKLITRARKDDRIFLITPDLGYAALEPFVESFPDRFINVGVAEQNAVGIAAGLALNGKLPYVYSIIPFLTSRPYEQIQVDCAYINTNVRLIGIGAGYSYGAAGATHHSINDIAIMRALPNMAVCTPGCINEMEMIIDHSFSHRGPMYIRLGRKGEPRYDYVSEFGKISEIFSGQEFAMIVTSNMLEEAYNVAQIYRREGKSVLLLSAHTIKPFDNKKIEEIIKRQIPMVAIEEHNVIGGLSSTVSEIIALSGKGVKFMPIAVKDKFSHYVGSHSFIRNRMGLSSSSIKDRIDRFLEYC